MNYNFEDFKKEVFTAIERMTEDVDSLDGFDQNSDTWWYAAKEIQIDYDDCIAHAKCEIQLNADWEGCFKSGDVSVYKGGTTSLVSDDEYKFTKAEQNELDKYLSW